jgi:hypothetical protein
MLQAPPDFDAADDAFKEAHLKRYSETNLLEYWSLTKLKKGDIPGLLRITSKRVAPNLSGVALLYRLAGHYRVARAREGQKDHAAALSSYQLVMVEALAALKENRTEPVTANVNQLATVVSNYIIEAAYLVFRRDSVDRILILASELTDDGYPPMYHLDRILSDVVLSTRASSSTFRQDALNLSRRGKLDGLHIIRRKLTKLLGPDHDLIKSILRAIQQVNYAR